MPTLDPARYLLLGGAPSGAQLAGSAVLGLSAAADLRVPARLAGSASLGLTAGADLRLPARLAGTATLTLTAAGDLRIAARLAGEATLALTAAPANLATQAQLAGFAQLRLTAAGAFQSLGAVLGGSAVLRLTAAPAGLVVTGVATALAGTAVLTLVATGDLQPSQAKLAGRAVLRLRASGALAAGTDLEFRQLRADAIQRPVAHLEQTAPTAAPLNVLRFTLESSLDTPADGWTAEVAGAALMLAADDEALYRLALGFLNAADEEVLAAQLSSGRILDRRLVGRATERRTYLRGYDALERTFRIQHRARYVPEAGVTLVLDSSAKQLQETLTLRQAERQTTDDPARATALDRMVIDLEHGLQMARDAEVPEIVGTWTAASIAAALVAGTGLTVSWECRNYTFAEPFDAVGTLYQLLRKLAEPWSQVEPFGVDITAVGTVVRVRHRSKAPPPDLTLTVKESRLVEVDLGNRRRLPLIGRVELEGRLDETGSGFYSGESAPGIGEPTLPVIGYDQTVEFREFIANGEVSGTRTYRMPDKLLIAYEEWVDQLIPGYGYWITKHETMTLDFEDSHYGPHGPLSQPLPLASHKEIETLVDVGEGTLLLTLTSKEDVTWKYDDQRFLLAKETLRYKRNTEGAVVGFPLVESIVETWTKLADGWYQLITTHNTFDPKTGKWSSTETANPQDLAGYPPGGPRLHWSFSTFISAPVREATESGAYSHVRVVATISSDPTAVPLRYANANLTRQDLEFILEQAREASGLVEYPLRGRGPALPDVIKGSAIHLTEYWDHDGTPIPLEPALVRGISFDYRDTRTDPAFECVLDAVFYRSE